MGEIDLKLVITESSKDPLELFKSKPEIGEENRYENALSLKEEKKEDTKSTHYLNPEEIITAELFTRKVFIANEHWEKTININSRITRFNNDYVICECLIDKEKKIFEERSFPRYLFNHIENIKSNPYVLLSIQSKIGSTRIDVIKGDNLVDKSAFELKDEWAKFEGREFNMPLDGPIQL